MLSPPNGKVISDVNDEGTCCILNSKYEVQSLQLSAIFGHGLNSHVTNAFTRTTCTGFNNASSVSWIITPRMSLWNSGDGEPSEEVQTLKNKLSFQGMLLFSPSTFLFGGLLPSDVQLAAQQTQLMKQAQQLNECQVSLNEAIHKVCICL